MGFQAQDAGVQEVRQTSRGLEAQKREEEMATWLSWQGKGCDWNIVSEQLRMEERERAQ